MQEFQTCLQLYQAGDYDAVIGKLQPSADAGLLTDPGMMLVLAQSCYKLDHLDKAARYFAMAGSVAGPKQLDFLQIAFGIYKKLSLLEEGMTVARKILHIKPQHREVAMFHRYHLHYLLSMDELAAYNRSALPRLMDGDAFEASIDLLLNHVSWCADEAINRKITAMQTGTPYDPERRAQRRSRPHSYSGKIRVGYLSNDFSDMHATVMLFRGILEHHDPDKFDIRLFCYTPDSYKEADKTFRQGTDFIELNDLPDTDAAEIIRAHDLDILVDLKGHTEGARIDLVNLGLAPIQVAYLGFPGSATGIDCDYVISDTVVTPDASKAFYHEKLCRLPESYQPNDHINRPLPEATPRSLLGLPEDVVVFASFNHIRKISPETLATWAAVLKEVRNSVLWILCDNLAARRNFLQAMAKAGIEADRIIFAGHAGQAEHLARLQAADIGLDTFPYNGHTTTSDKLWAGLPVVTKRGSHFASRVSESLLLALGVPELVANDQDGYVRLCAELASDPARLAAVRRKIAANRFIAPLFDTERSTRHLEAAYGMMVERAKRGVAPDHLDVPALSCRTTSFGPAHVST